MLSCVKIILKLSYLLELIINKFNQKDLRMEDQKYEFSDEQNT